MNEKYQPVQSTPFSLKTKVLSRLWRFFWCVFYRPSPWFFYKYRVFLLNIFGANVSYRAKPANSAFIEYPWNLSMDYQSSIGENSWIYCLDKITISKYSCIGQNCKLIAGSHNYKSRNFELVTAPINIGQGCWLTSSVTVLMGVDIGDYTVVGINSLVTKSINANLVVVGSPVKVIGERFVNGE